MEKNKKLEKKNRLTKKSKILTSIILASELLFIFRGPKLYGVLIFMITIAIIFIILDKDDTIENDNEVKEIKKSIIKEIDLIEKSTKKLNYKLASKDKLNEIVRFVENINEKYFFIKKNYEGDRGMDTLTKLINELKTLENNLKEINDKLLTFYVSETNDKNLNEDLDHIINQLDAQKIL